MCQENKLTIGTKTHGKNKRTTLRKIQTKKRNNGYPSRGNDREMQVQSLKVCQQYNGKGEHSRVRLRNENGPADNGENDAGPP